MRRAVTIFLAVLCAGGGARAAADPYAVLKLYEGSWRLRAGADAPPSQLQNRCARTGLFYRCERLEAGETVSLLLFLPVGADHDGKQNYRTQALGDPAAAPSGWNTLTIDGRTWLFEPEDAPADPNERDRTVTVFIDDDHLHYEVQRSVSGGPWLTTARGDEERVK
jgi:hypothetical protein